MGRYKEQQIVEADQGWSSLDKNVCADCVVDYALKTVIEDSVEALTCDYCLKNSEKNPIAARVDVITDAIERGLETEYGNPDDQGVMYATREGGYQLPVYDTSDLLDDLYITEDCVLLGDLSGAIDGPWCQRNPYRSSPVQVLSGGWKGFREYVTQVSRYMFHLPSADAEQQREEGEIPPQDMLAVLAMTITKNKLTRTLAAGSQWIRLRPHDPAEQYTTAKDLGSPPPQAAKANRMSAAGISMFYGAETCFGALAEVAGYSKDGYHATLGAWQTTRPMLVIDLVNLPEIPSLFDDERRYLRSDLGFLHGFADDVRRPAEPDDHEHLDYVPTQVVAEYLREVFRDEDGNPAMGVLWPSSKDKSVTNCVLFVGNEDCADGAVGVANNPRTALTLDSGSLQHGPISEATKWVQEVS